MQKQARPGLAAGFTLIELLVVIVIIAILVTLSVPRLSQMRKTAKETQTATNLAKINQALAAFGTDNNGQYPFRLRYYDQATYNQAGFDPYDTDNFPPTLHTEPVPSPYWFSLGLIGGVRTVEADFSLNTVPDFNDVNIGKNEHKIIQPANFGDAWYRRFNQYSDPLRALGYLGEYPENPFLKRPMGAIAWSYGEVPGTNTVDRTIPFEGVLPTPGDFVYTFFYGVNGNAIERPGGVNNGRKSYVSRSETMDDPAGGAYYVDLIDSYQMWAYGNLPVNGTLFVAYPNNIDGLSPRGMREAKKDFDRSGTKDMYEIGMCSYYKVTASGGTQAMDTGGKKLEF